MSLERSAVTKIASNSERNPAVLMRIGGGRAPFLMGLRVLDRLNTIRTSRGLLPVDGIFPIDSDREVALLKTEATDPNRIIVDRTYASITRPYIGTHGNFSEHIATVATKEEETKAELIRRFGPTAVTFDGMSVGLGQTVTHRPRDIIGVLDAGSRYPSTGHKEHVFFFPVLASRLWRRHPDRQDNLQLNAAVRNMRRVERNYTDIFLSKVNTFSYRSIPKQAKSIEEKYAALSHRQPTSHLGVPIEYTPPMSPNTVTDVPKDDVIRPSMYVMFSGTGSGIEQTNALIPEIVAAGYDVYVPESAILYGDVSEENITLVKVTSDPNITGNPLVTKGLARWGFGTIWDDINEGKGIDSPPHPHDEDREIIENGLTIRALEIGEMLFPGQIPASEEFRSRSRRISHNARRLSEEHLKEFGTKDGLAYIAERLAKGSMGHSRGEVFLSTDERNRIREVEESVAPDLSQGSRVPFRGRYRHIDEAIFINLRNHQVSEPQKVLEYEPGMFDWGSPSAHDTIDAALNSGVNIEVTSITASPPENPSYPEVTYKKGLKGIRDKFDMVRMLHVGENLPRDEYEHIKAQLVERVREGGFFVETLRPDIDTKHLGIELSHNIFFFRKQKGKLVMYMTLNDGIYPRSVNDLVDFQPGPDLLNQFYLQDSDGDLTKIKIDVPQI